jgi:tetratricopeptide (TPR) repeat protein
MNSFTEQAVALLADGQRATAAALFDAARALKPQDLTAQNNYAFCILIDRPQEARDLLTDVLARGIDEKTVAWCNIALAESLLGNNSLALDACEKAYEAADGDRKAFLWQQRDGDWVVEETKPRLSIVHMGAELEQSPDVSGGTWAGRLSLLETPETSSDPSSVETSGEDL